MNRPFTFVSALAAVALSALAGDVVLENASCRLTLDAAGFARSLTDKASGEELLLPNVRVPFATLTQERPYDNEYKLMMPAKPWTHKANRIVRKGGELHVGFEDEYDTLVLRIRETDAYIGLTLVRIDYEAPDFGEKRRTEIDALSVFRLPLRRKAHFGATLNVTWDETAAAALLAANAATRVEAESDLAGGAPFWAGTELRSGIMNLSAALTVRPKETFLDAVDTFERDFNLPRGVESRRRADVADACYFATDFRPQDLHRHLAAAKEGGFGLFMLDLSALVTSVGTYALKPDYPNGLADIAALGDRIRAAGLRTALHGYPTKVQLNDPMATTNLDARLNVVCDFLFARDTAGTETDILAEGPVALLRMDHPKRRLFASGRELIEFTAVEQTDVPGRVRLTGCTRGVRGTAAAAHRKGERLHHLDVDDWPVWIRANPYTSLPADLADRIAAIWKALGCVLFYFDGAEDVPPPYWHHVPRAQRLLYDRLDPKPLYCESALKSHFGWHINSRGNAFDVFAPERIRTAMRACNLRCAAQDADDFTCVDFGWLNLRLPERNPKKAKQGSSWIKVHNVNLGIGMQPDHFEYVFAKALSWDSPVTVQFTANGLASHPRIHDCLTAMNRWERARREKWLSARERIALRNPETNVFLLDFGGTRPEGVACRAVTTDAERPVRAFSFTRSGASGIVCWDMFSPEVPHVDGLPGGVTRRTDGGRLILLSSLPEAEFAQAFRHTLGYP